MRWRCLQAKSIFIRNKLAEVVLELSLLFDDDIELFKGNIKVQISMQLFSGMSESRKCLRIYTCSFHCASTETSGILKGTDVDILWSHAIE